MDRRSFGPNGPAVSEYALGTMTFGAETPEQDARSILDRYVEAGGNLIDVADVYAGGESEEIVGRWLERSGRRDELLIATKARFAVADGDDAGLGRERLVRAVDASLRRLRIETIDVHFAHCWDPAVPMAETLGAWSELVEAGKIRHVAVSNFAGWQLAKTVAEAGAGAGPLPLGLQAQYSLLAREIELELVPACADAGLALMPWSPLGGGWLTGKYRREHRPAGATRLGEDPDRGVEAWDKRAVDRTWRIIDELDEIAASHDCEPAHVALAWLTGRPFVATTILGVRTLEQLESNLGGVGLELTAGERDRLDELSAPAIPDYPYGFLAEFTADRS